MGRNKVKKGRDSSEGIMHSFLMKFGAKVMLGLLIVVVFLTMVECTIKKPESPVWNTSYRVPVLNRTYPMDEIIRKLDQDGLQMDDSNNVVYTTTYDVDTVSIDDDNLSVPDISYSVSEVLGPISLDAPSIPPVATAIGDIGPLAAALPGVVPAASFSLSHSMPAISNFSSATVASGRMWVVVNNQLGVDLTALDIEIYDLVNAAVVSSSSFASGVPNGVLDSVSVPLDGRTISDQLEIRMDASNSSATVLSLSQQISTEIKFESGLTVSSASAVVPALSPISFSESATLGSPGDADVIHRASLTGGNVNLSISNNTALDATLDVVLPDLLSGSTPLTIQRAVSAHGSVNVDIDLADYDVVPRDVSAPQTIDVDVVATVPGSGGATVNVDQNDDFSVTATVSSLSFDEVTGVFAETGASFDPFTEDLDIPEGFEGVGLVSSIITLEIDNGVILPGDLDLLLSDGAGREIVVTGSVAPATVGGPVRTTITVVDSAFLNPIPESVIFSGSATFGDGVSVGTISADDFVFARVTLTSPLEMVLTETTFESDIEGEDIDQEDIDLITDHVVSARLTYHIENHLPVGVSVGVLMGGDTTAFPGDTNHVIPTYSLIGDDAITVQAAPTVGGIVPADSASVTGERYIILTNEDVVNILENDTLFIEPIITLQGSGGQPVKLTSNDYVTVYGLIEVEYRFDGEF